MSLNLAIARSRRRPTALLIGGIADYFLGRERPKLSRRFLQWAFEHEGSVMSPKNQHLAMKGESSA